MFHRADDVVLSLERRSVPDREHVIDIRRDAFAVRDRFEDDPGIFGHGQEDHAGFHAGMEADTVYDRALSDRLLPDLEPGGCIELEILHVRRLGGCLAHTAVYHLEDLIDGERFFKKIVGPHLNRLDRGRYRAVARYHDDPRIVLPGLYLFQYLDPVHLGHPDIEKDDVRGLTVKDREALLAVRGLGHGEALVLEDPGKRIKDILLVVDDKHLMHDAYFI